MLHSTRTRLAGMAAIASVVVVAGLVAGTGSAVGEQNASASLTYACAFPAGTQQVPVTLAATLPTAGTAGQAIQPTKVGVTVALPEAALADLTKLTATAVGTTAQLGVAVGQNGAASTASWSALTAPSAAIPATGPLTVAATGSVAAVTPAGSGDVTFTAGPLDLVFTPTTASGTATNPAAVPVSCTLNTGQNAVIATVPVPSAAIAPGSSSGAPVVGAPPATGRAATSSSTTTSTTPPPVTDPKCPGPPTKVKVHAWVVGRSNLNKLNESVAMGPGEIVLTSIGSRIVGGFMLCYAGVLGMPPSTATVVGFNVMPTTTTMTFDQVGYIIVEAATGNTTAVGYEEIYVSNASVNGTALNLGSNCRTSVPVQLNLKGVGSYNPVVGGPLEGYVTIPSFTGCGVNENLDPLLDSMVSGSGDLIRMIQGKTCPVTIPQCVITVPPFK